MKEFHAIVDSIMEALSIERSSYGYMQLVVYVAIMAMLFVTGLKGLLLLTLTVAAILLRNEIRKATGWRATNGTPENNPDDSAQYPTDHTA